MWFFDMSGEKLAFSVSCSSSPERSTPMIVTLQPSTGQALGRASTAGETSAPITIPAAHNVAKPTRFRHRPPTALMMLICRSSLPQDGRFRWLPRTYRRQPRYRLADECSSKDQAADSCEVQPALQALRANIPGSVGTSGLRGGSEPF